MRSAGVLMPITSLPSPWGIGTLGRSAREFLDFLAESGQTYWQLLPIGPTGYGDSPYQPFSSYAGNPYLIDLDDLAKVGLLLPEEYQGIQWSTNPARVDYGLLYQKRFQVLKKAVDRLWANNKQAVQCFCDKESYWLEDYALFMSLKSYFGGRPWKEWPEELRHRERESMSQAKAEMESDILFWKGVQFLFFEQWERLKSLAEAKGISIIGDIPIYVAEDSSDVWAHPDQFQMDADLHPTRVAGCPPDGFSADGQLWGNPLFNWEQMRADGYHWWLHRISFQFRFYDVLRIDHFRGFDAYYAIPASAETAKEGTWEAGPGLDFFRAMEKVVGQRPIIAEDLGFLTPSVHQLLKDTGYPGMKVLEFAFDSRDSSNYLPHTYTDHCICYTGTHDNSPLALWRQEAKPEDIAYAQEYLALTEAEGFHWGVIRGGMSSVAELFVAQMQDYLGLGAGHRMNIPGTQSGNWQWRLLPGELTPELAEKIRRMTVLYGRADRPEEQTEDPSEQSETAQEA